MVDSEEFNKLLDDLGIDKQRAIPGELMAPTLIVAFRALLGRIEKLEKANGH